MSRYDDALWAAADAQYGDRPSGTARFTVERPVPVVGTNDEGWREYAVTCEFDEGGISHAHITAELMPYRVSAAGPVRWRETPCSRAVTLTENERITFETDFSEREAES